MVRLERITFDPAIMGGRACIRGMRVTVALLINLVANGMTSAEIMDAYPYLEREDIRQALQYAAWLAKEQVHRTSPFLSSCAGMRFLLDMGISPKIMIALRQGGHDAIHLLDQQLHKLPDPAMLEKARHENRILLTHDLDFAELVAASGAQLPSVVIFRLRDMRPEPVGRYLNRVIGQYAEVLERDAIISVTESQARLRHLPL